MQKSSSSESGSARTHDIFAATATNVDQRNWESPPRLSASPACSTEVTTGRNTSASNMNCTSTRLHISCLQLKWATVSICHSFGSPTDTLLFHSHCLLEPRSNTIRAQTLLPSKPLQHSMIPSLALPRFYPIHISCFVTWTTHCMQWPEGPMGTNKRQLRKVCTL